MEKELYNALARVLLEPQNDQWNNIIASPLQVAIEKWANENQKKIIDKLLEKITVEKLADVVGERLKDAIGANVSTRYLSGYDRESYQQKLNDKILEKVVEILAQEKLKELKG